MSRRKHLVRRYAIVGGGSREAHAELDDLIGENHSQVERSRVEVGGDVDGMDGDEREGRQFGRLMRHLGGLAFIEVPLLPSKNSAETSYGDAALRHHSARSRIWLTARPLPAVLLHELPRRQTRSRRPADRVTHGGEAGTPTTDHLEVCRSAEPSSSTKATAHVGAASEPAGPIVMRPPTATPTWARRSSRHRHVSLTYPQCCFMSSMMR